MLLVIVTLYTTVINTTSHFPKLYIFYNQDNKGETKHWYLRLWGNVGHPWMHYKTAIGLQLPARACLTSINSLRGPVLYVWAAQSCLLELFLKQLILIGRDNPFSLLIGFQLLIDLINGWIWQNSGDPASLNWNCSKKITPSVIFKLEDGKIDSENFDHKEIPLEGGWTTTGLLRR